MDIIFPSRRSICWHWHNIIRKAFPCTGAATAASSIVDSLVGNHSHDPLDATSVNHSHDPLDATTVNTSTARHLLPPNHPQTIRVSRIAAHIIATACECDVDGKSRFGFGPVNGGGFDWRVDIVVDEKFSYACSNHKGILTVSTGFLENMRTDSDIAATLGHEVAHVMARHVHETQRKSFWVSFLVNFAADLLNVPRDRFTEDNWEFMFLRPSYFRQEYEADHLGLLLVAAAGYDPHIALKLHEKFRRLLEMWLERRRHSASDDDLVLYWSRHPPQKERIRRLSQPKVMGEALDLYEQALRSRKGEHAQALDSWSSTFTFGLSWAMFWAQECLREVYSKKEWLQGIPNLWNCVRNSFISSRPCGRRNHVAHQVVPAPTNWRFNKDGIAAAGSPCVQKDILFRYGMDYASGCWQLQNNHVHCAHYSAYVQGNICSDQPGATRDRKEVKLFMWQLSNGRLWPAERQPHALALQGDKH